MSKKNIIGLTISIILIVLAVIFYKGLSQSKNRPGDNELGYYFDLNTRELFVRDGTMRPPPQMRPPVLMRTAIQRESELMYMVKWPVTRMTLKLLFLSTKSLAGP